MMHSFRIIRPGSTNAKSAAAFTLVELLVVITIIGVLLGLLLPAIQAARESARRNRCGNNLRQMGVAIQNYHGQHRRFPPGAHMHKEEDLSSISWRVMILPFMEEISTYDEINPTPDGGAANWAAQSYIIDSYLCPSAPPVASNPLVLQQSHYSGIGGAARNNERLDLEDTSCGDLYTNGIFYPASRTTISKITDGTSHTAAIGERTYIFRDWISGAEWFGMPPSLICSGASNNIRNPINADVNQFGYYRFDFSAPTGAPRTMVLNDLFFGSYHTGGAQFCFADGSARMIPEEIGFTMFENLSTINGRLESQHVFDTDPFQRSNANESRRESLHFPSSVRAVRGAGFVAAFLLVSSASQQFHTLSPGTPTK